MTHTADGKCDCRLCRRVGSGRRFVRVKSCELLLLLFSGDARVRCDAGYSDGSGGRSLCRCLMEFEEFGSKIFELVLVLNRFLGQLIFLFIFLIKRVSIKIKVALFR